MNKDERILFALHLFVGIGAIGGGLAVLNPDEPLGMPVEALKNAPFSNYLIPGTTVGRHCKRQRMKIPS